jgi:hypothetical protein
MDCPQPIGVKTSIAATPVSIERVIAARSLERADC